MLIYQRVFRLTKFDNGGAMWSHLLPHPDATASTSPSNGHPRRDLSAVGHHSRPPKETEANRPVPSLSIAANLYHQEKGGDGL